LIREELQERATFRPPDAGPFCVNVVAVVPKSRNLMDSDNLCKGLLDSLSKVVYEDDRHIQCVTSRRLLWGGAEGTGYYLVGVRQVEAFDEDVVWDDPAPPTMGIGRRID
jgi:Endodeoxyribonuclease RusA